MEIAVSYCLLSYSQYYNCRAPGSIRLDDYPWYRPAAELFFLSYSSSILICAREVGPKLSPLFFPLDTTCVSKRERRTTLRGGCFLSWLPRGPWGKQPTKFTASVIHIVGRTGCAFSNMAVHWLEETLCVDSPETFWLKKSKRKRKKSSIFQYKAFHVCFIWC